MLQVAKKMGSSNTSFHGFDIFYSTRVLLPPAVIIGICGAFITDAGQLVLMFWHTL